MIYIALLLITGSATAQQNIPYNSQAVQVTNTAPMQYQQGQAVVQSQVIPQTIQAAPVQQIQPVQPVQTVRPIQAVQTVQTIPTPRITQPVAQPTIQPVAPSIVQPVGPPVIQPVSPPVIQPVSPPIVQPVAAPVIQPVTPPIVSPVIANPTNSGQMYSVSTDDSASDGDVYNFYFQKAPSAKTVIQAKEVGTLKTESPAKKVETEPKGEPLGWRISAGPGYFSNPFSEYDGFGVDARYSFNRYFGVQFGLGTYKRTTNRYSYLEHEFVNLHLGVSATPLVLSMFGHDLLGLSFLSGVHTTDTEQKKDFYAAEQSNSNIQAYLGLELEMYLGSRFSLALNTRVDPDSSYGSNQLIFGYNF